MRVIHRNLTHTYRGVSIYRGTIVKTDVEGCYQMVGRPDITGEAITVTVTKGKTGRLAVLWAEAMEAAIDEIAEQAATLVGTYVVAHGLKGYQHGGVALPEGVEFVGYYGRTRASIAFVPQALGAEAVDATVAAIRVVEDTDEPGHTVERVNLLPDAHLAEQDAGHRALTGLAHRLAAQQAKAAHRAAATLGDATSLRMAALTLTEALTIGDVEIARTALAQITAAADKVRAGLA